MTKVTTLEAISVAWNLPSINPQTPGRGNLPQTGPQFVT
jgi:hypothetical protein